MADSFVALLKEVISKEKKLFYTQRDTDYEVNLKETTSKMEGSNFLELDIKGEDQFGSWKGKGAFMEVESQPFFWMLKFYDHPNKAKQTGKWSTLVYEAVPNAQGKCKGRWFF